MPLASGIRLGPYEILAPIGAGGMGEVYKARDTRLDRIVAIKQLKGQHSARFRQEGSRHRRAESSEHLRALRRRSRLPGDGIRRGQAAIGSAAGGGSREAGSPNRGRARRSARERHSSPRSQARKILVTRKGVAKLLDFGLAKLMTDSDTDVTKTIEGTVLGTAAYMAPEQAEGKPLDERSDVFSFGAVLYEMLSGDRAFVGNSYRAGAERCAARRSFAAPGARRVQRIVKRCLAKQPADRFPSMAELRVALEQISAKPAEQQPSIAVLPFANMSADKENEYFSDGLAEEILNVLAKIPGLKVIARTSSFAFRGKNRTSARSLSARRAQHSRRQRPPRRQPHPRHGAVDQCRRRSPISGRSATIAT